MTVLIGGWLFWRWPDLNREIAVVAAAAQTGAAVPAVAKAAEWMVAADQQSAIPPQLALAGQYVRVARLEPLPRPNAIIQPVAMPERLTNSGPAVVTNNAAPALPQLPQLTLPPAADPASQAYALLASGQKRAAARKFREALTGRPDDPRATAWTAQLRLIEKRWSGSAYVFGRASGLGTASVEPVLGGGQSGAQLAYAVAPLARRPLSVTARGSAANTDAETAELAFGLKWQLLPALTLSGERLVPAGSAARSAWTLRLAGGTYVERVGPQGQITEISTYAEAGIIGARRRDLYAAGTARIGRRIALGRSGVLVPGLAAWGSVQQSDGTAARLEVGPSLQLRLSGPAALSLTGDYRQVVTGNARPASGPALTVAASF